MAVLHKIKCAFPNTYREIQLYIDTHHKPLLHAQEHISVDLEIGILIGFCAENAIELSFPDGSPNAMQEVLMEAFHAFEKSISHYS